METKFKIVETEEYTLAVSDEDASNSYIYFTGDPTGIFKTGIKYKSGNGNYFYQDAITGMSDTYLTTISKKIIAYKPKGNAPELDLPLLPNIEPSWFNKVEYTEYDLNKAVNLGLTLFEFFQSLKQPKWFVAEMEVVSDEIDHIYSGNIRYGLKTITINNKTYLVGTYLN